MPYVLGNFCFKLNRVRVRVELYHFSVLLDGFNSFWGRTEKIDWSAEFKHFFKWNIVFSDKTPNVSAMANKPAFFTCVRQFSLPPLAYLFLFQLATEL